MFRLLLFLLLTSPAVADGSAHEIATGVHGSDKVEIEKTGPGHFTLTYHNSSAQGSLDGIHEREIDGLSIAYRIKVGMPDETIMVQPPEGFVAIPEEATIPDGDAVKILIVRPMM